MTKILIIDDDLDITEMYETKFQIEGFDTRVCTEWFTALWIISDFNPDVILLDIMMPQMNGFEVLTTIKNLARSIHAKIIMFSNLSGEDTIQKWMDLWADLYLIKAETTPKVAVEKVLELLEKHRKTLGEIILSREIGKHETHCPYCDKSVQITLE